MRLAAALLLCAAAHAVEIKTIECVVIKPDPHYRAMAKVPDEYNCTVEFTGKTPKETLYVTRTDGATMAFTVDKGQRWAAVATGQAPAASAKLGENGRTVSVPKSSQ